MEKSLTHAALFLLVAFMCTGCIAGDGTYLDSDPANFWSGWWHGMLSVFTLIWGLFDQSVEVYERVNNGGWYDLGFLFGAGALFGGGSSASSSAADRRRSFNSG